MTEADVRHLASDQDMSALAQASFELILELQDASGAYPASPTFSAYAGYSWFRDGAFIADAVEKAKASGLVASLIAKHGVEGLSVAPPALGVPQA